MTKQLFYIITIITILLSILLSYIEDAGLSWLIDIIGAPFFGMYKNTPLTMSILIFKLVVLTPIISLFVGFFKKSDTFFSIFIIINSILAMLISLVALLVYDLKGF